MKGVCSYAIKSCILDHNIVKSILQVVPAYTMSSFLLSKKMCKKLSSISSNFWWGDKASNGLL
jgi:hypothetical protein